MFSVSFLLGCFLSKSLKEKSFFFAVTKSQVVVITTFKFARWIVLFTPPHTLVFPFEHVKYQSKKVTVFFTINERKYVQVYSFSGFANSKVILKRLLKSHCICMVFFFFLFFYLVS